MSKFSQYQFVVLLAALGASPLAYANLDTDVSPETRAFNFFTDASNGWTEAIYTHGALAADGKPDGVIAPGGGGQAFDTEYLFFKYTAGSEGVSDKLSIGLQSGFNLIDNRISYNGSMYYGGDLALSFDGIDRSGDPSTYASSYEYAVDFGKLTKDKIFNKVSNTQDNDGNDTGYDAAGLYSVSNWNDNITQSESSPFAMTSGDLLQGLSFTENDNWQTSMTLPDPGPNSTGRGFTDGDNASGIDGTYYRIVTFDLNKIIGLGDTFTVDAHWTMSCGNDDINGRIVIARNTGGGGGDNPVPEPSALALMFVGSLGLGFPGIRRRFFKRS